MWIPRARALFRFLHRAAGRRVEAQTAGPPPDREAAIEMPAHPDAQPGTGAPATLFVDLQGEPVETHRIVAGHDPLFLVTENLIEVGGADRDESAGGIGRGMGERG